jgi:hypothetical protein
MNSSVWFEKMKGDFMATIQDYMTGKVCEQIKMTV